MDKLTESDGLSFIKLVVKDQTLVGHNLDGYNDFINNGISNIITQLFNIDRTITTDQKTSEAQEENETVDRSIKSYNIKISFSNVEVAKPTATTDYLRQHGDLTPIVSKTKGKNYTGAVSAEAKITLTANFSNGSTSKKIFNVDRFVIVNMPIMVGSEKCTTYNLTSKAKEELNEDPNDLGGYFIVKKGEYSIDLLESKRNGSPHIYLQNVLKTKRYGDLEFIGQSGGSFDNSSMLTVKYKEDGTLDIKIDATIGKIEVPFYVIYRLFGMNDDLQIINTIVFNINDRSSITTYILDILSVAFHTPSKKQEELLYEDDRQQLIGKIAKYFSNQDYSTSEGSIQHANNFITNSLDKMILPHMGTTDESRNSKLRFIGLLIHKCLLVCLKVLTPDDRDSYIKKRVHGAGVSLAKAFKPQLTSNIITPLIKKIRKELTTTKWENINKQSIIDMVTNVLNSSEIDKALEQGIASGNRAPITIKKKSNLNKISAQPYELKNKINAVSVLRSIVVQNNGNSSTQTERADKMRRVHPTYDGYICIFQSADSGERVGVKKTLAITATVCVGSEAEGLKKKLLLINEDTGTSDVIPLANCSNEDISKLSRVFVNGDWIGCVKNPVKLRNKYVEYRRTNIIADPKTTITMNPTLHEVEFWTDVGRLTRPLFIVYNNIEEYDKSAREIFTGKRKPEDKIEFKQWILFTKQHVERIKKNDLTLNELLRTGVVEYITPEENAICNVAEGIGSFYANENNIELQFTHCSVQQSIFGIAALTSPYGNHTQPVRITHATNHARQASGWYAFNFQHRIDKNRFFQFYVEKPLVKTLISDILPNNGSNCIVAYATSSGNNQEDSIVISQAAIRRGLFSGVFFKNESYELNKGEHFSIPDPSITKGMKPANYSYLDDEGLIKVGTIVRHNDVLIGIVAEISRSSGKTENYKFVDKSIIYKLTEPAMIVRSESLRSTDGEKFAVVILRYDRYITTGDKCSSRCGNKGIVASILPESDMPFTQSGLKADIIMNPTSQITRMTVGQLLETLVGKIAAKKSIFIDGTSFLPVDHKKIKSELVFVGHRHNGHERMYDGRTGLYSDFSIFIGPTYIYRLQKFVLDDEQAVGSSGPTDAMTGQPLGGKNVQGGLKIGEMETWGLTSHGAIQNMFEKTSTDSDGRIMHICRNCGTMGIYNPYRNKYNCTRCKGYADLVAVETSKSAILLKEKLAASNIDMRLIPEAREFLHPPISQP